ncbi:BEN domain-containing protein 5 [Gadus morhua]|uniref:BEN domain-containing protein 5 n=1 Tax=Gadus morhua TaxID=8049 RepID=UPI0011B556B4|nr:BEN domain-containing protein 5 [Gadus morhua]
MYAFVRFLDEDMCYALPISNVKDFRPLHKTDFDNQKVYLVHRTEENDSTGQPCEAQILALAETVEEFEDSIMQKKMKIPKMSIKYSGNSIENHFEEDRLPLRHKKASPQDHGRPTSTSSKSLAAVVARLERNAASSCTEGEDYLEEDRLMEEEEDGYYEDEDTEGEQQHLHQHHHHHHHHQRQPQQQQQQQQQQQFPGEEHPEELEQRRQHDAETDCGSEESLAPAAGAVPRVLYEELVHSYRQQEEEMRRLQQELERTRRQLVQQAKKLKEYGSLLTEVKELRDFNRRLQDVLLMRLGSEPMHDNGTQTMKAEAVEPIVEVQEMSREEANTSSSHSPSPRAVYTCNDGKVHLGGGIWVEEEKWHQLQRTQGDSKFTKNLAVMIWGTETLKNRSVTGVATKKKKDALPKPPLSPSKLKIVRECLYDRVSQETADSAEITQRLSKVNKYICEKIMDINKSIKNEERRESKLLIRQTVKMENYAYDAM